jgi:hypothetical protein
MATTPAAPSRGLDGRTDDNRRAVRRTTETKAALKATRPMPAASEPSRRGSTSGSSPSAYMVSRGLAKSGSRDPYIEDRDRH